MTKKSIRLLGRLAVVAIGAVIVSAAIAQTNDLRSLRGDVPVTEEGAPPEVRGLNTDRARLSRAYRQQPPLIPHRIEEYQINLKVNQCMRCHDWPHNVEEGAPKISETHYHDRNGVKLDQVAPNRYFCNQCHVPQASARELVRNRFRSATEVD